MTIVTRMIPDLEDELATALIQIEELLLALRAWGEDPDEPTELPLPLTDGIALDALRQVWAAVVPTQSRHDHPTPPGRILGPDGRYEHRPLRLVDVDAEDLAILSDTAQVLGHALAAEPDSDLAHAMATGADAAAPAYGPAPTPVGLVELLARIHGLLDLADTADTDLLRVRVAASRATARLAGVDIVLSQAEEDAYQRTADRFDYMWTAGCGSDRFLF